MLWKLSLRLFEDESQVDVVTVFDRRFWREQLAKNWISNFCHDCYTCNFYCLRNFSEASSRSVNFVRIFGRRRTLLSTRVSLIIIRVVIFLTDISDSILFD